MWVTWAVEMLLAGFDGEHLVQLAGESPPYNGFEMDALVDKVLEQQGIPYSDKEAVIQDYVCFLTNEVLAGKADAYLTLRKLTELYENGVDGFGPHAWISEMDLSEFANLYWTKEDLLDSGTQWYWPNATRENIDDLIRACFQKRQLQCRQGITAPRVKSP